MTQILAWPTSASPARWASSSVAKSPKTTGPAPDTSARNAPSSRSSAASGDEARSFAGRSARSREEPDPRDCGVKRLPAVVEAAGAVACVERLVDLARRRLLVAFLQHEEDAVVAREPERLERRAVAGRELRADRGGRRARPRPGRRRGRGARAPRVRRGRAPGSRARAPPPRRSSRRRAPLRPGSAWSGALRTVVASRPRRRFPRVPRRRACRRRSLRRPSRRPRARRPRPRARAARER